VATLHTLDALQGPASCITVLTDEWTEAYAEKEEIAVLVWFQHAHNATSTYLLSSSRRKVPCWCSCVFTALLLGNLIFDYSVILLPQFSCNKVLLDVQKATELTIHGSREQAVSNLLMELNDTDLDELISLLGISLGAGSTSRAAEIVKWLRNGPPNPGSFLDALTIDHTKDLLTALGGDPTGRGKESLVRAIVRLWLGVGFVSKHIPSLWLTGIINVTAWLSFSVQCCYA